MTCHVLLLLHCNTSEHLFIVLPMQKYALLSLGEGQESRRNKRYVKLLQSKGPESQLILVMDNFHCTCYCWSSEPKGKEKNDFHNIHQYCNVVLEFFYE